MDPQTFREALLQIMERKTHWAWSAFTSGKVARERLHLHFEQEERGLPADQHRAPVMGRSNEGKPGTRKTRYGKSQKMRMGGARKGR